MKYFFACIVILTIIIADVQLAEADSLASCNNQFTETSHFIQQEYTRWTEAFGNARLPAPMKSSYIFIVRFARDSAQNAAEAKRAECSSNYGTAREIADLAILMFSRGLSSLAPTPVERVYVDESEIRNGYPLGAPRTLIIRLETRFAGIDNSTIGVAIRQPMICLTTGAC